MHTFWNKREVIKTIFAGIVMAFWATNAASAGWQRYYSGSNDQGIFTEPTKYSAPIAPHLVIWCNQSGFDVSLTTHELVGNGRDIRSLTSIVMDEEKMSATWGISTTNKALFIERIGKRKIQPVEFISMLLKHKKITIDYPAIEGNRFTKRNASFSMSGARELFSSSCAPR